MLAMKQTSSKWEGNHMELSIFMPTLTLIEKPAPLQGNHSREFALDLLGLGV